MRIIRHVRPVNLLIICLLQLFIYFYLVKPWFDQLTVLPILNVCLVIFSTLSMVLIAAAGYIHNDLRDVQADKVNRPSSSSIARNELKKLEQLSIWLAAIGVLVGITVCWSVDAFQLSLLYVVPAILLWFYNGQLQHQPIAGNLLIALLCSLTVLIIPLLERSLFNLNRSPEIEFTAARIFTITLIYAAFAFLYTWLRELIKDMEDIQGDQHVGAKTFAIAYGVKTAKTFGLILYASIFIALIFILIWYSLVPVFMHLAVISLFIILPLGISVFQFLKSNFSLAQLWLKISMFGGILSIPILYYVEKYFYVI